MGDPYNIEGYVTMLYDSSLGVIEPLVETSFREQAKDKYNKRKQAFDNAGYTEEDLYLEQVSTLKSNYWYFLTYYSEIIPQHLMNFIEGKESLEEIFKELIGMK